MRRGESIIRLRETYKGCTEMGKRGNPGEEELEKRGRGKARQGKARQGKAREIGDRGTEERGGNITISIREIDKGL